ncbi:MAG: ABC transporter permease [Bradymonadaceae bacterium]|nr:ABC transporter permease [Lujinxingiaceae bacterium]
MLKLAWRNLWRNRTRTLIIGSAVAFSYALMLISMGINDDSHRKMEQAAERAAGGAVLIHAAGYWESQASDMVIEAPEAVMDDARTVAGVRALVPRVAINGLVSSPRGNEPIRLTGMVPALEFLVDDLSQKLVDGQFLGDTHEAPIVLSQSMVEKLKLELGDKVVLTASTPDGEVTRALFHLDGVISSGIAGEANFLAYTTLEAAQKAVEMQGKLSQIGVLVGEVSEQERVAAALRKVFEARGGLEVLTWQQAIPEMKGLIEFDDAFGYIYLIVIFIIVLLAIANTFLMAVMERVREYGLLNAIGLSPARIGKLVIWESVLLALIAMVIGFAMGFSVHLIIDHVGINAADMGAGDMEMAGVSLADMIIRSELRPLKWLIGSCCVFAVVMVSALYPAWRATRLSPAQAMRFYE